MGTPKKALIYSPYLDSLGGGERYVLSIAKALTKSYQVEILWNKNSDVLKKANIRFNLKLEKVRILNQDLNSLGLYKKYKLMSKYDLAIFLTDGSVPFMFAKKNYLHIQTPEKKQRSLLDILKVSFINKIICNSQFTERFVQRAFRTKKTCVLYPPVDPIPSRRKIVKTILSVGRFSDTGNAKRQDILIAAFKKLLKIDPHYRLILTGSSPKKNLYLSKLKKTSNSDKISFVVNPGNQKIKDLYATSQYFWHAAGYGVDENKNPESTEHFGIAIAEAISANCITLTYSAGGVPEIINKSTGILWESQEELIKKTLEIKKPFLDQVASVAKFNPENFSNNLLKLIQ